MNRVIALRAASGLAAVFMTANAFASIDGIREASYGAPLWVQSTQTQFGTPPNGSELAAFYCKPNGANLDIFIAGNLEANFNKLNIFFDTKAGGQNQITNANPGNDGWLSKYGPSGGPGFRFDNAFFADYMLIFRRGNFNGDKFDVDYAEIGTANGNGWSIPGTLTPSNAAIAPAGVPMTVGYTNLPGAQTIGGGTGAANQANALAQVNGLEFSIPYAALGLAPGTQFLLSAHVNSGDHNYLSNQFIGSMPVGQGNLGGDGVGGFNGTVSNINLNNFVGDQYIVVPAPGALALVGMGGLLAARRRRA